MSRDGQATFISRLRNAAERCIVLLGTGLLRNASNATLVARVQGGELGHQQFFRQLRVQLLQIAAWMIGERRGAVPRGDPAATLAYREQYAVERLCRRTPNDSGQTTHSHWRSLQSIMSALWQSNSAMGISAWNSELFDPAHTSDIRDLELSNDDLATLLCTVSIELIELSLSQDLVSGAHAQLLGYIHEWLLELHLVVNSGTNSVSLVVREGHERKATGSYFTPNALVQNLLDVCLESALDSRLRGVSPDAIASRILALRIVDPACGTGVFLLAAARRLARRIDVAQGLLPASSGIASRNSLREVVSHCIYGVDLSGTAVSLCRLILWFECGPPYEPPVLLGQHLKCGNSIFGAWPGFELDGIADVAFEPAVGDDSAFAKRLKRRNRIERLESREMKSLGSDGLTTLRAHADPATRQFLADFWCAAYVWPKRAEIDVPTHRDFQMAREDTSHAYERWQLPLNEIATRHKFFHWHLQFADVCGEQRPSDNDGTCKTGGFDFVIGNPPWVAHAGRSTQRLPLGLKHFLSENYAAFAGYPTTHGVFIELAARVLNPGGRIGLVLPASVADLNGYAPTRRAHDERCVTVGALPDYGEGQFTGVTQPCIALVSQRQDPARQPADCGKPWELERSDLDATGLNLLARLSGCATLPEELFGERGFQSTPALRKHICRQERPLLPFSLPLREGTDVREFCLGRAQHFADACLFGSGLRPLEEFAKVAILVRQTARYPIAARNDGVAFRNSLLAVLLHPDWPWSALSCILNSSLIRWNHYFRFRDGRQPILPQLKVGHLRSIPAPVSRDLPAFASIEKIGVELAARNQGIQDSERAQIDECVRQLYGISQCEHRLVTDWHGQRPR